MLLALVRERFPDETAALADVRADETDALRRSLILKDTCETIKWWLSATGRAEVFLSELQPPREFVLERAEFEELIRPLLAETIGECERLLERLDLDWPGVDRIAPVGGSSKIPLVGEMLAAKCGRPVLAVDRPDTAVAYGAALFGRGLQRDQDPRSVVVNGRRTVFRKRHLTYDDVIGEAPGQAPAGSGVTVTVTYQRSGGDRAAGSLVPGGVVEIQDGTIFNVTTTDKS
jgi:molecular chaperone DnaK (HSP70)